MKSLFTFTLLTSSLFAYIDIVEKGYEQYQDIFVNGKVVKSATHNHKDCGTRYEIIKRVLNRYKRPFTLLDIGAAQGYYSLRTAHDYPESCAVMLEANNGFYPLIGSQLLSICQDNTQLDNIIFLNSVVTLENLVRLGECEHFDVVLAFNIIHWFPHQWREISEAILNLGYDIIIETPPMEEWLSPIHKNTRKNILSFLKAHNATELGKVPRHTTNNQMATIFHLRGHRTQLLRKTWIYNAHLQNTHKIACDYTAKTLTKKIENYDVYQTTPWCVGINLMTYLMCNGDWPTRNRIKEMMWMLRDVPSNDWMANNMILQGNKLTLIDVDDPNHASNSKGGHAPFTMSKYNKSSRLIQIRKPSEVEEYFYRG